MHDKLEDGHKLFVKSGNYYIYINVTDAEKPWVIRYPDEASATGHNEIRVAHIITSNVWMRSDFDPFIDGKLGKWKVVVFKTSLIVDLHDVASFGSPEQERPE